MGLYGFFYFGTVKHEKYHSFFILSVSLSLSLSFSPSVCTTILLSYLRFPSFCQNSFFLSFFLYFFVPTSIHFLLFQFPFLSVLLGKVKAVPLQASTRLDCSRKLRFPDFMITAQDGGKVVSLTHRPPLPPGNTPGIHFC